MALNPIRPSAARPSILGRWMLLAALPLVCGGCVVAAIGAGAAAAYSLTGDDTVQVPIERSYDVAFDAALNIVESWAGHAPKVVDREGYYIFTEYDGTDVNVNFRLEGNITLVVFKVRKGFGSLPDPETAQDLAEALVTEVANK